MSNDRLVREITFDKGSERVQAMRDRFGEHYGSAIGRAYASGLLGEETIARVRYDAGKRFQRAVERFFTVGAIRSAIGSELRSGAVRIQISGNPHEEEEEEWEWVCTKSRDLDRNGMRPWLDQLLLPMYHDGGPYWLDALPNGGKHPADRAVMDEAIKALDFISPEQPAQGIRVVRT